MKSLTPQDVVDELSVKFPWATSIVPNSLPEGTDSILIEAIIVGGRGSIPTTYSYLLHLEDGVVLDFSIVEAPANFTLTLHEALESIIFDK